MAWAAGAVSDDGDIRPAGTRMVNKRKRISIVVGQGSLGDQRAIGAAEGATRRVVGVHD
jgi:hypothetical protein